MLPKLALRVCPEPGCPKIAAVRCPDHDLEMVRVVYARQSTAAEREILGKVTGLMNDIGQAFGATP